MNETEKQLYELLMEIKEAQVRLIVTSDERAEVARSYYRRIAALEEKVDEMTTTSPPSPPGVRRGRLLLRL